tara:strand:- start:7885 stop:8538 length:654 start_codon:yes stop_codon:yes gene_type:complete
MALTDYQITYLTEEFRVLSREELNSLRAENPKAYTEYNGWYDLFLSNQDIFETAVERYGVTLRDDEGEALPPSDPDFQAFEDIIETSASEVLGAAQKAKSVEQNIKKTLGEESDIEQYSDNHFLIKREPKLLRAEDKITQVQITAAELATVSGLHKRKLLDARANYDPFVSVPVTDSAGNVTYTISDDALISFVETMEVSSIVKEIKNENYKNKYNR